MELKNQSKESFGQRLSRLRKKCGYTQEEVAERECVSPQAVSKWENDVTSPDIQTLVDLSDYLSVSLDELMGKESDKPRYFPDQKDPSKRFLRLRIHDEDSTVNLNLPVALIQAFLKNGEEIPIQSGSKKIPVDFKLIMELVEQGMFGEILSIEDGTSHITVTVE